MLLKRKGFEIRLRCHVLGPTLRPPGEASHRRAVRGPDHGRGIRAARGRRRAGRVHHVQHPTAAARPHRAALRSPDRELAWSARTSAIRPCRRSTCSSRIDGSIRFSAAGSTAYQRRRIQQRQLRSQRAWLPGWREHRRQHLQRSPDSQSATSARHAAVGHEVEGSQRRVVRAFLCAHGAGQLLSASRQLSGSRSDLHGRLWQAALADDVQFPRQ